VILGAGGRGGVADAGVPLVRGTHRVLRQIVMVIAWLGLDGVEGKEGLCCGVLVS